MWYGTECAEFLFGMNTHKKNGVFPINVIDASVFFVCVEFLFGLNTQK